MSIKRGRRLPFVVLPWAVLEHPSLSGTDVLVYCTIARFADNGSGEAYPSRATVATYARCSVDTVDRSIKSLEAAGLLTVEKRRSDRGGSATNLYTVHEIAEQAGGGRTHAATPSRTRAAPPSRTHAARTRTIELEPSRDVHDPSEWTLPPDDVRARIHALGIGGDAA